MSNDFPTLRPITTRPVALNLAAWDIDCLPDPLDSEHVAMEIVRHLFPLPQSEELESEPASCYLCRATAESDPDVTLHNAGLPQSDLRVCSRCDGGWQHQTDKREAWLAEESEV